MPFFSGRKKEETSGQRAPTLSPSKATGPRSSPPSADERRWIDRTSSSRNFDRKYVATGVSPVASTRVRDVSTPSTTSGPHPKTDRRSGVSSSPPVPMASSSQSRIHSRGRPQATTSTPPRHGDTAGGIFIMDTSPDPPPTRQSGRTRVHPMSEDPARKGKELLVGSSDSSSSSAESSPPPRSRDVPRSRLLDSGSGSSSEGVIYVRGSGRSSPSSDFFARSEGQASYGSEGLSSSPQGIPIRSARIGREHVNTTDFVCGFSDQMTPGGKHWLPGTEIDNDHTAYHRAQDAAAAANTAYKAKEQAYPSRPDKGRIRANARGSSLDVGNRTIEEHRELRRHAADAWRAKREEVRGREEFNAKYHRVWEKRKIQTEFDTVMGHETQVQNARVGADGFFVTVLGHEEAMLKLGASNITPVSSWGSSSEGTSSSSRGRR